MKVTSSIWLAALLLVTGVPPHSAQQPPALQAQGSFWALVVSDLDASVHWYEAMLGMHVVKRSRAPQAALDTVVLEGHNLFVEMVHFDAAKPVKPSAGKEIPSPGFFKGGVIIAADDFDRLERQLQTHGAQFVGEEFVDKEMHQRSFLVKDNGGNIIQFFTKNE